MGRQREDRQHPCCMRGAVMEHVSPCGSQECLRHACKAAWGRIHPLTLLRADLVLRIEASLRLCARPRCAECHGVQVCKRAMVSTASRPTTPLGHVLEPPGESCLAAALKPLEAESLSCLTHAHTPLLVLGASKTSSAFASRWCHEISILGPTPEMVPKLKGTSLLQLIALGVLPPTKTQLQAC